MSFKKKLRFALNELLSQSTFHLGYGYYIHNICHSLMISFIDTPGSMPVKYGPFAFTWMHTAAVHLLYCISSALKDYVQNVQLRFIRLTDKWI